MHVLRGARDRLPVQRCQARVDGQRRAPAAPGRRDQGRDQAQGRLAAREALHAQHRERHQRHRDDYDGRVGRRHGARLLVHGGQRRPGRVDGQQRRAWRRALGRHHVAELHAGLVDRRQRRRGRCGPAAGQSGAAVGAGSRRGCQVAVQAAGGDARPAQPVERARAALRHAVPRLRLSLPVSLLPAVAVDERARVAAGPAHEEQGALPLGPQPDGLLCELHARAGPRARRQQQRRQRQQQQRQPGRGTLDVPETQLGGAADAAGPVAARAAERHGRAQPPRRRRWRRRP